MAKLKKKKYIFFFQKGKAEGKAEMKNILGGKGANLAEMAILNLPVPPGFTISAEVCSLYYENNRRYPPQLEPEIRRNLRRLERVTGKKFGDPDNPLLVSVRSGAATSMPGMMDTVLNLGLNSQTVEGLANLTQNQRFAWDAYRRFISMFGDIVMGVERSLFEKALDELRNQRGYRRDTDLTSNDLKLLVATFKEIYKRSTGEEFPEDPYDQLRRAIDAVFGSWEGERCRTYRRIHNITGILGTAVNVQTMVFGNMGEDSCTGVCFTRDPATGENIFYGEYLLNAQGEDVVAGIRTPRPVRELKKTMPEVWRQLLEIKQKLEKRYRDMQDIEFTVERGALYMLQTRTGKRTAAAAVKIATDMVKEKLITEEEALLRIEPDQIDQLLHPSFDPKAEKKVIAKGLPASPGAATGKVVFSPEEAERRAENKEPVILVRPETSPEDIGGMHAAEGILTSRGGMTSHAAVVARGMGKCCIVGCSAIQIEEEKGFFRVGDIVVEEGEFISIDGTEGTVMLGRVPTVEAKLGPDFKKLMRWADKFRKLGVRTNADTPTDARLARQFGAEGIGLCRTEHMFFEGDRIIAMREMILAEDAEGRKRALDKLLPMQRGDFEQIFEVMNGLPVTIRLLDPPLHEFLPKDEEAQQEMAEVMGITVQKVEQLVEQLSEMNPMLGLRGCRLGIVYPEVYDMQVRAILEASCAVKKRGIRVLPEIMIPLVGTVEELQIIKRRIKAIADEVMKTYKTKVKYAVGTMIEVPRASLRADEIAREAEFFSFGTNDLTQMTYGYSRDDVARILVTYLEEGILPFDPFQKLDQSGVGELVKIGTERGRAVRADLKVGICGEHGGEPSSVEFCHRIGLDYVSCSPYRVPIARLTAAQSTLKDRPIPRAKKKTRRKKK